MIRIIIRYFLKFCRENTPFGGSLMAIKRSFLDLYFNVKSTLLHLFNYYFNFGIHKFSKLNIGCGDDIKEGFCNIDLGKKSDVYFDARNRMPFKSGSIDLIYTSHFIEHLEHYELIFHFQECFRMLSPNGLLRMAIPDFKQSMKAYLANDIGWLELGKKRFPTPAPSGIPDSLMVYADYLDRGIHEYGTHKQILDFEKVKNLLIFAGFSSDRIILSEFNHSLDNNARRDFSFFVEARK